MRNCYLDVRYSIGHSVGWRHAFWSEWPFIIIFVVATQTVLPFIIFINTVHAPHVVVPGSSGGSSGGSSRLSFCVFVVVVNTYICVIRILYNQQY